MAKRTAPNNRVITSIALIALGAVLTIAAIYFYGKSRSTVMRINGQPVSRVEYLREAERVGRDRAVNIIITRHLIFQEGERQKIKITDKQIDEEIKKLEAVAKVQKKTVDQILKESGLTRDDLILQIKTRKISEKIAEKHVKVSETEVINIINRNRNLYPAEITPAVESQIRDMLYEQKLTMVIDRLIVELRKKAKIEFNGV